MIARYRIALLAAAIPMVAGCGVYLHRPDLETSTAALKTSFGQLSAPAYLEQQQRHLDDFAAREDRAVAEYQVASRNYSLLNILRAPANDARNPDGSAKTPAQRLTEAARTQIHQTAGVDRLGNDRAAALDAERSQGLTRAASLEFHDGQTRALFDNYRNENGTRREMRCADFLNPTPPALDPPAAQETYAMIRRSCVAIATGQQQAPTCAMGLSEGRLFEVCERLRRMRETDANPAQREDRRKALAALNRALAAARAPSTTVSDEVLEAARDLRDFAVSEDIREVLTALDTLLGEKLVETLDQISAARDAAFQMPATAWITGVLEALGAAEDLARDQSRTPLDEPSAILIAIARVRHQLNLVELNIQRNQRLASILEAEAAALRTQTYYLARVEALCSTQHSCGTGIVNAEALSHFASSFDKGLIPYEVLRSRELQVDRAFAIRRAQAAEADYRALLQPAFDQMAAYGAGGVKPDVLGPFLASLPVTGAILGR
ncbi:MAG TPA: hypothetical protein VMS43_17515 [Allosphingosinicella sp.]|nr:hypothetical protein [Allosphingosinicella sp.]